MLKILTVITIGLFVAKGQGETRLDFQFTFEDTPIVLGEEISVEGRQLTLSRLDFLISDLAVKKRGAEWVESQEWVEYLSVGDAKFRARIESLPTGEYEALRFRLGLTPEINGRNPNSIPSHSPLHPLVNGLHWGWSDGFIFAAIEGRFGPTSGGFSYHLAGDRNALEIELPVEITSPRDTTIFLQADLSQYFKFIRPDQQATSSHSREKDELVPLMQRGLTYAFSITGVSSDQFQKLKLSGEQGTEAPAKIHGSPYDLAVSERLPTLALPADNPLTREGVALGEKLFHDRRLSGNNSQSCASCHQRNAAFSDTSKVSIGAEGTEGARNSMPLFNLGWHERFFWDGRSSSLRDQVLHPIIDPKEMNQDLPELLVELGEDEDYAKAIGAAFGSPEITKDRIAKSLEQFLLSIISQDSRFDRAARGEVKLTAQELRGLDLFVTENDPKRGLHGADCFHCHGGNLFTNRRFTNNGLKPRGTDNLGLYAVTGNENDRGRFKTPSLRNVALTGPYMHDGRFVSLAEVVTHYNSGVHRSDSLDPNLAKHPSEGIRLSPEDQEALIAFLHTLSDSQFETRPVATAD